MKSANLTRHTITVVFCLLVGVSLCAQTRKTREDQRIRVAGSQSSKENSGASSSPAKDTVPAKTSINTQTDALLDTTFLDYDEIFSELDALIDSLYQPRSFAVVNTSLASGYFNYTSGDDTTSTTKKQGIYGASFAYYHKSGLGIGGGASFLDDGSGIRPFQFSITGSYDYVQSKKLITGIAFTHYITQDNLPFYTTPLQNELYAYFTYRNFWLKPSVSMSYGWGSRTAFEEQKQQISIIKKKKIKLQTSTVQINSLEQIADFTTTVSVRHDFFLLHPFGKKDYFRITPQVGMVSGTSQFGFNQSTTGSPVSNGIGQGVASSELFTSQNTSFENNMNFRPMSVTTFLKTEYVNNKFYFQPQLALDYFLQASEKQLTPFFVVNAGIVF